MSHLEDLKQTSSFISNEGKDAAHTHGSLDRAVLEAAKDDNAQVLAGQDRDFTPQEERAVVRKLDLIMLPIMAAGTGFQLIDKSALGAAATLTLKKDLGLEGTQYSWAVTIYYFGLLAGTWPANILLQRYHTGKFVGIAFILWAATMLAMLGVSSFASLAACRFLLGVLESPLAPAWTLITARFWKQTEQPLRFAAWSIANTVLPIPFTVIYYAIGTIEGGPLENWRWIFLMLGLITIVVGVIIFVFLPDQPASTWWLNDRQKAIVVQRVAKTQVGIKSKKFKPEQMKEALMDVKAWLLVLALMCQQTGVSLFTNFSGQIVKGFGYTGLKALLLQIPAWAVAAICIVAIGCLASLTRFWRPRKTWLLSAVTCVVIVSGAVVYTHPPDIPKNKILLTVFMTLLNMVGSGYGNILALSGQNFAGATKKQTVVTMMFLGYCVSNICIPQAFLTRESPRYQTGVLTVMCCQCVLLACYGSFYFLVTLENGRRVKARAVAGLPAEVDEDELIAAGLADETDKRNPFFRYSG